MLITIPNKPKKNKQKRHFRQLCIKKLRKHPTKAERTFKAILDLLGIEYEFQRLFWGNRIVDFYLPKHRLIIEIDGKHHNWPSQSRKDRNRDTDFYLSHKKVIRFKNEEVANSKYIISRLSPYIEQIKACG